MKSFIKIFKLLNKMEKEDIINQWAIGGSIAFMFYTEPFLTKDIDIFIYVSLQKGDLVDFGTIYSWLLHKGYKFKNQYIEVDSIKLDFIPTTSGLVEEAVLNADTISVDSTNVKVIKPEYLVAVALEVGRKQDYVKIDKMVEQYDLNKSKLKKLISKFNLFNKWEKYLEK